jgi:hypothetical protein
MSTMFLTELWRSQLEPYQRVAWFLFEAMEREHRLNVQAMLETSTCLPDWPRSSERPGTRDADVPSKR